MYQPRSAVAIEPDRIRRAAAARPDGAAKAPGRVHPAHDRAAAAARASCSCTCSRRSAPGIGGGGGAAGESAFATVLVAGVVGLTIMFQGIQAVALPMVQEFGYTRRSRTGCWRRCRCGWWRSRRSRSARCRACWRRCIVFPIAAVVHARRSTSSVGALGGAADVIPLACVVCSSLGLTFGTTSIRGTSRCCSASSCCR